MDKIIKVFLGCILTSIGVILLKHSQIVTGGTAGLSLTVSYFTNIPFSTLFFIINLPFYIFSFLKMGWKFTLSTLAAVTTLSILTGMDKWLPAFEIPTLIGAIFGGSIIGLGLSIIFMNGASLGGSNMLALFLQKKYGIDPGKTNFIFDFLVVTLGIYSVGVFNGVLSVLSIAITSSIISYFKGRITPVVNERTIKYPTQYSREKREGYSL